MAVAVLKCLVRAALPARRDVSPMYRDDMEHGKGRVEDIPSAVEDQRQST